MIKIVDYGLGNIAAFKAAYKRMGYEVTFAQNAEDIKGATKLVLPGVGSFDHALDLLDNSGMRRALEEAVLEEKVPILGICVGMQILAYSSEEGCRVGLNWIPGHIRSFDSLQQPSLIVPHMGWNDVAPNLSKPSGLFEGLEAGLKFYFLHSYFFECDDENHVLSRTSYGRDFCSAVQCDNIYGVQFHPEKSHRFGSGLLKNFAEL